VSAPHIILDNWASLLPKIFRFGGNLT